MRGVRNNEIASVDLTGGEANVVQLVDNGVPKVLLEFSKGGVVVRVALDLKAARSFDAAVHDTLRWVDAGGPREWPSARRVSESM